MHIYRYVYIHIHIYIHICIYVYIQQFSKRFDVQCKKGDQILSPNRFSVLTKKHAWEEFSLGKAFPPLGLPWEIGLAETHQTLVLNGLRRLGEADGRWDDGMFAP